MGCCASKPPAPEELPLADLRKLIERSPPDKKEELERVARLKEGLSNRLTTDAIVAHDVLPHLKAGLGEFPDEVWAWPEGKRGGMKSQREATEFADIKRTQL